MPDSHLTIDKLLQVVFQLHPCPSTRQSVAAYHYRSTPLFNVLLKKFKKTTGGKLKACLSGGGAISAEVQEWVRTALDAPLVQGYGLTESCAAATIQMPDDMSIGVAGEPALLHVARSQVDIQHVVASFTCLHTLQGLSLLWPFQRRDLLSQALPFPPLR